MTEIQWLLLANVAFWLGLGAYVAFLAKGQRALDARLSAKESMDNV